MQHGTLTRQSITYPLAGAALATGAPVGLMLLRRYVLESDIPIREDIRRDLSTYAYLATSTTIVFTLVGRALGRYTEQLAERSTTDGLTGLLNRRAFHSRLQQEVERSRRSRSPLTLLLLDLDHLKALNDAHGHEVGDQALAQIGHAIRDEMRSIDVGARLGGDEFGFLAVGTDRSSATSVARRLLSAIADQNRGNPISVSIGAVTFDPSGDRMDEPWALTRAADRALYAAKREGRNRVAFGALEPRTPSRGF